MNAFTKFYVLLVSSAIVSVVGRSDDEAGLRDGQSSDAGSSNIDQSAAEVAGRLIVIAAPNANVFLDERRLSVWGPKRGSKLRRYNADHHLGEPVPDTIRVRVDDGYAEYRGPVNAKGEPHGSEGAMTFPNRNVYLGEFKNGVQHGHGILARPDGFSWKGPWVNG